MSLYTLKRRHMPILGQLTSALRFEANCGTKCKEREDFGVGSMKMEMQRIGSRSLDESFLGVKIEYLSYFDLNDKGTEKQLRWCSGIIEEISDGTWQVEGKRRGTFHRKNEAERVSWDAIPEAKMEAYQSVEPFIAKKWNENCDGAWRLSDLGDMGYVL